MTKKWWIGAFSLLCAAGALGLSACSVKFGSQPAAETLYFQRIEGKDEYRVIGVGTYTGTEIIVPETYKNLPVTEIGQAAFEGCENVTEILLPPSVTAVGEAAFRNCCALTEIVLPLGVTSIDYWVFDGCENLTDIYYGGTQTDWETVSIALYNNALDDAALHAYSATEPIGRGDFWRFVDGAPTLWTTVYHEWGEAICVAPTCTQKGYDVRECTLCDEKLYENYTDEVPHEWGMAQTVAPTCTIQGYDVKTCQNCSTEKKTNYVAAYGHTFGEWHTVAPTCLEQGCQQRDCTVCDGTEKKDYVAPVGHGDMENGNCVDCGAQLSTEGLVYELSANGAFATVNAYMGTSNRILLADTYQGAPVVAIGDFAFANCTQLTEIVTLNGITSIGEGAFMSCTALTSIQISASVMHIGTRAFYGCTALTEIAVDANNTVYKSLDGHLYTKQGETLLQYAVGNTSGQYTLPDGVKTVAEYAVAGATYLQFICLSGATQLDAHALEGCTALWEVAFTQNGLTKIANSAFANCTVLEKIQLPDTVTELGAWVFSDCKGLKELVLPDGLTKIGEYAFFHCDGLKCVTLGERVTKIGAYAFGWCRKLAEIRIPASVTDMGANAFAWCTALTIECQAASQPETWNEKWNPHNLPTVWGK